MSIVSLSALGEFHSWILSGGEHRAGLPLNSTKSLHNSVQIIMSEAIQIAYDLERLRDNWSRVERGQARALVRAYLSKVVVDLNVLHLQSNALIAEAAQSNATLQQLRELVRLHVHDDRVTIAQTQSSLENARKAQEQARRDLSAAKNELEGSQGFWNGLLTGLTFGIYNPLLENIKKANSAIMTLNSQIQVIECQLQLLNQSSEELLEGNYLLDRMNNLEGNLNEYLNFLTGAETSLQEAIEDAERSEEAQSEKLGAYYKRQAGEEMNELFSWIDTFKSVR
jgi:uncharacterized protein YoxC